MPAAKIRRPSLRRAAPALALILTLTALLALVSAPSAIAAPAWRLDSFSNTTVAAGAQLTYMPQATNIGDAATNEPLTLVAHLGAGLSAVSAQGGQCSGDGPGAPPNIAGASVVTCSEASSVESHRVYLPHITVAVAPGAPQTVKSSFEVSAGGAGAPASTVDPTRVGPEPPFGIDAFDASVTDASGAPFTQAAGHPFQASTSIDFDTVENPIFDTLISGAGIGWPVAPTKDVTVDLPAGFIADPTAASKCTAGDLAGTGGITPRSGCAPSAQVGTALVRFNGFGAPNDIGPLPLYDIVAPPTVPARFGFNVVGTVVTFDGRLRSDGDYGLTADATNISQGLDIAGSTITLWGVPSDPSHDSERACTGVDAPFDPFAPGPSCPSSAPRVALLRNPSSCSAPGVGLATNVRIDSWAQPGAFVASQSVSHLDPSYPSPPADWGAPQGPTGCERVPFTPTFTAAPQAGSRAGQPAGFAFDLTLPQSDDPSTVGEADLKRAVVTLPQGVRVSPAAAQGLAGCSPEQIALHSTADPSCPDQSKLGTLSVTTPLLEEPLSGSVYLATPHNNPSGSLIAIYLVVKGPGVIVKLPGEVSLDPATGQISTTFDNNPQLPFSKLHLDLQGGPGAPLVLPSQCGTYTTHAVLSSWSEKTVTSDSSFTIDQKSQGGPCPSQQFSPGFTAGVSNPIAAASSPFSLQLTRSDQDQDLASLNVSMPPGLIGRISSTTLCPEAQAAAGTCAEASKIGDVTVGAGAGSNPFYISSGRAYITAPYKGAPFGLSIVVPAIAGPFDLGDVVVRSALFIDPTDAHVRVVSDPLPQILQGIPLDVRDIRVMIDRPGFIVNPTSCQPMQISAEVSSLQGTQAHLSSPFALTNCAALSFKPSFSASTQGNGTFNANGASLKVHIQTNQGSGSEANIAKVDVQLPIALPSRLKTLQKACTEAQFATNPAGCPPASNVGSAIARTPVLPVPLQGPAYLVSHGGAAFPDLVLVLQGEGVIVRLTGNTQIKKGITFSRFDTVPDAPISSFDLTLPEGPYSALAANGSLCAPTRSVTVTKRVTRRVNGHNRRVTVKAKKAVAAPLLMPTTMTAQSGAVIHQNTKIAVTGCAKVKVVKHAAKGRGAKRGG